LCSPPDICMSPWCTSKQVFRRKKRLLFHFPRCGLRRTKWEDGIVGSGRPNTTACRPWATKKRSQRSPLFDLNVAIRRFHCVFLCGYRRNQRLNRSIKVLRRSGFPSSYCFPQFANASSVVDLGSSLTIKACTVTIFSGHTILSGKHAIPLSSEHANPTCMRILLGSIRPPRGRQSTMNRRKATRSQ
jgi:hypothetical protein